MSYTFPRGARYALALAAVATLAARADAQSTAAAPTTAPVLKVGDQAPDFALRGATRYGVLEKQVRLGDYRGQTVVLAFFFRARTKG